MRIQKDGFELEFTKPVDKASAESLDSYEMKTHTYVFQGKYGSPRVDASNPTIKSAKLAKDGKTVRLVVEGMQRGHVHELKSSGLRSKDENHPLLHDMAYYTIWHFPKS